MFETLDAQIIPVAATAAGFAAGVIAERKAIDKAAHEREALVEDWGLDETQAETVSPEATNRFSQLARKAGRFVTVLSVSTAVAGGLSAEAWLPLDERAKEQKPALEVVIDHSGATNLRLDGTPPIKEINDIAGQFQGLKRINPEAIVASSGRVKEITLDKVKDNQPFGDAPLEQATQTALDRAGFTASKQSKKSTEHNAGVVVLTNGNEIGNAKAVISEAKQQGNVPVFVVNVEGGSNTSAGNLRRITRQTGGKYWAIHQNNLNTVARDVKKTISASQQETANPAIDQDARNFLKFLSILSIAGVITAFRSRGKTPFQRTIREG